MLIVCTDHTGPTGDSARSDAACFAEVWVTPHCVSTPVDPRLFLPCHIVVSCN
jgi:hypothetical protein